ncbi:MAG: hypothetical protein AAF889_03090 [Cyanobacteria bacterium P01_D01_bin.73]
MITFDAYPGIYVFQIAFTLAFTGIIVWQTKASLDTIDGGKR